MQRLEKLTFENPNPQLFPKRFKINWTQRKLNVGTIRRINYKGRRRIMDLKNTIPNKETIFYKNFIG